METIWKDRREAVFPFSVQATAKYLKTNILAPFQTIPSFARLRFCSRAFRGGSLWTAQDTEYIYLGD
jgi:hypothetical protein